MNQRPEERRCFFKREEEEEEEEERKNTDKIKAKLWCWFYRRDWWLPCDEQVKWGENNTLVIKDNLPHYNFSEGTKVQQIIFKANEKVNPAN